MKHRNSEMYTVTKYEILLPLDSLQRHKRSELGALKYTAVK